MVLRTRLTITTIEGVRTEANRWRIAGYMEAWHGQLLAVKLIKNTDNRMMSSSIIICVPNSASSVKWNYSEIINCLMTGSDTTVTCTYLHLYVRTLVKREQTWSPLWSSTKIYKFQFAIRLQESAISHGGRWSMPTSFIQHMESSWVCVKWVHCLLPEWNKVITSPLWILHIAFCSLDYILIMVGIWKWRRKWKPNIPVFSTNKSI